MPATLPRPHVRTDRPPHHFQQNSNGSWHGVAWDQDDLVVLRALWNSPHWTRDRIAAWTELPPFPRPLETRALCRLAKKQGWGPKPPAAPKPREPRIGCPREARMLRHVSRVACLSCQVPYDLVDAAVCPRCGYEDDRFRPPFWYPRVS